MRKSNRHYDVEEKLRHMIDYDDEKHDPESNELDEDRYLNEPVIAEKK